MSHVAAVLGTERSVLYFNGRAVVQGAGWGNESGTPFVVGCAGKDNRQHYFAGRIRSVRISRGERYNGDFAPPPSFAPDDVTVLIYEAVRTEGGKVIDLSGRENHGILEGVIVMGAEDSQESPFTAVSVSTQKGKE